MKLRHYFSRNEINSNYRTLRCEIIFILIFYQWIIKIL